MSGLNLFSGDKVKVVGSSDTYTLLERENFKNGIVWRTVKADGQHWVAEEAIIDIIGHDPKYMNQRKESVLPKWLVVRESMVGNTKVYLARRLYDGSYETQITGEYTTLVDIAKELNEK